MKLTSAILRVTISGIGSVVSPIPSLITFAFGYFLMCSSSLAEICSAIDILRQNLDTQWQV